MRDWKKYTVWQLAHQFVLEIYKETLNFPKEEDYNISSQLRRASSSIPTNIVEGAGRDSEAEFNRFLIIAQGSANEVQYLLLLAKDLGYLNLNKYDKLEDEIDKIKRMLYKLSKRLSNKK